jgi:chromosome segregation ATPase
MSEEKQKKVNDNDLLVKLSILRTALLDERKKSENFQNELNKLKEENLSIIKSNDNLKEENILKKEQIEKLKSELSKYKNKNGQKNLKSFFNQFFEENEEKQEDDETIETINLLKEKISLIENEKTFINGKLNELMNDFNKSKESYEIKIKDLEKNYNIKLNQYEKEIREKEERFNKEIEEKNKIINENIENTKYLTNYIKTFDSQKIEYENRISKIKLDIEMYIQNLNKKNEEIQVLFNEQEHLLQEIEDYKKEIQELKVQITQYKVLLDEFKPISIDHIFTGYLIPIENNGNLKIVEISFGKIKNKLSFKIEKEDELILSNKEVVDIIEDKERKNRVKIILKVNKVKNYYICDFTEKEVQMILEFFYQFKKKPSLVESALMGINTDYFY